MEDVFEFIIYSKLYLENERETNPSLAKNIAIQEINIMEIPLAKGYKTQKQGKVYLCVAIDEGQTLE